MRSEGLDDIKAIIREDSKKINKKLRESSKKVVTIDESGSIPSNTDYKKAITDNITVTKPIVKDTSCFNMLHLFYTVGEGY